MLGRSPATEAQALAALAAYPGGLQIGGGITPDNARRYLDAGASHVIVTSYVFREGKIDQERLARLVDAVGKDRLVLDLSCRWRGPLHRAEQEVNPSGAADAAAGVEVQGHRGGYYVVTDRWQKFTDFEVKRENIELLASSCAEFLVHGVDVEGLRAGIQEDLVELFGEFSPIPVTYAGGARNIADLERVRALGAGRVDLTIGSALDVFGGDLCFDDVMRWQRQQERIQQWQQPRSGGRNE